MGGITIGIDIAKRIFQIHGVDKNGKAILRKKELNQSMNEALFSLSLIANPILT